MVSNISTAANETNDHRTSLQTSGAIKGDRRITQIDSDHDEIIDASERSTTGKNQQARKI